MDRVKAVEWCKTIAECMNRLRLVPRVLVGLYGWLFYEVVMWFLNLPDPSMPQAAFVSTMVAGGSAFFGFYTKSGSTDSS